MRRNNIKLYYIVLILVYIVGHHNVMQNTTTRLAIEVQKLPPFPFSWNDRAPQKDRLTLKEEDVLPNQEDGLILHGRMVQYVMGFLVEQFATLRGLKDLLPKRGKEHTKSSNVVPMKLLFQDESRTDDNIQILHQLAQDANLSGSPQVSTCMLVCLCLCVGIYNVAERFKNRTTA